MVYLNRSMLSAALALPVLLGAGSAWAAAAHSWVSSNGSGTACTRAMPCATYVAAEAATLAGGVVSLLDSMDLAGAITMTKSITLRVEGADAGITYANSAGANITVNAGPSDIVTIEGLHLNSGGISFNSGRHLHIVRCVIANDAFAGEIGINFMPNSASRLSVTDTIVTNFGSGTGGGIVVRPAAGGSAQVNLERVIVNGNAFGVAADGSASTAGINMTIADSMIGGNTQDGVIATSGGGAPIGVMLRSVNSINNNIGVRSIGPNVTVRLDNTAVIGNGTGLAFLSTGALLSFGNNNVEANATNGAFSSAVALK